MSTSASHKEEHTLDSRKASSASIRAKHPDRIPVIVVRPPSQILRQLLLRSHALLRRQEKRVCDLSLPDIDKKKFLVPSDLTIGQFVYVIRKVKPSAPTLSHTSSRNAHLLCRACRGSSWHQSRPSSYSSTRAHCRLQSPPSRRSPRPAPAPPAPRPARPAAPTSLHSRRTRGGSYPVASAPKPLAAARPTRDRRMGFGRAQVYDDYKDEDGFLYMTYSGENTFGAYSSPEV